MLALIDRLAGWWLDWRLDRAIAKSAEAQQLQITRAELGPDGFFVDVVSPTAAFLADEMAAMLNKANAENYVEFDLMPRLDRGLRPVRVTVQWASGMSPAQKAAKLETELQQLQAECAEWKRRLEMAASAVPGLSGESAQEA